MNNNVVLAFIVHLSLNVWKTSSQNPTVAKQWFENDKFLCHCENKCDSYGNCDNGKCAKGWFGFKCQYQDLATVDMATINADSYLESKNLTDQDQESCYNNINSISIKWTKSYPFSWLRVKLKNVGITQKIQLEFSETDPVASSFQCDNMKITFNLDQTIDIGCELKQPIKYMKLTGGGEICSLNINAGRNMALKQWTNQTSTFKDDHSYPSTLAVDGNADRNFKSLSCTHTNDPTPKFEVTFPRCRIYRIDVYNRDDSNFAGRLSNFNLRMFDNSSTTSSQSASNQVKSVYTLYFSFGTTANKAELSTVNKYNNEGPFLTLCEVEIYGDCVPGTWGLSCEQVCSDRCPNKDCNRDTGECIEGCTDIISPMCLLGPWFGNDTFLCHCDSNSPCNSDGICLNEKCEKGWFGFKCQYQDLMTLAPTVIEIDSHSMVGSNWLTDRNDSTCNNESHEITIKLSRPYPFSWMRLVTNDDMILQNLMIQFSEDRDELSPNIQCINMGLQKNPDQSVDVKCDIINQIQQIKISKVGHICSLYINGGRNMALYQDASQSLTFIDNTADRAVDGNRNGDLDKHSCSHTDDSGSNPFFQLRFPRSLVYRIDVYNRVNTDVATADRLSFSHYFLLDGEKETSHNTTGKVGSEMSILIYPGFNKIATELKISTNHTRFLTLCEVEVYGECAPGIHGLRCENSCNDKCYNKQCNRDTGDCTDCDQGYWGTQCKEKCNKTCFNQTCNRVIGTCNDGCVEGYHSPYCNLPCNETTWGRNCETNCNSTCNKNQCNRTTGACTEGCTGYDNPPTCDMACRNGFFGLNCTQICSRFCDADCDNVYGFCSKCKPGYKGASCDQVCDNGTYGLSCIYNCSDHCQTACNKTSGYCFPCEPGFRGDKCDLECHHGTWGAGCSKVCNKTCLNSNCSVTTGSCKEGCIEGYQSKYCNQTCDKNHYGRNCSNKCSNGCKDQQCNGVNGTCFECPSGYKGDNCETACQVTTWGPRCYNECSFTCLYRNCNGSTGKCKEGCIEGYTSEHCNQTCDEHHYGRNCSMNCSTSCLNQTCQRETGECKQCPSGYQGYSCIEAIATDDSPPVGAIVGGIIGVLIVAAVIIAAVILWRKRTSHKSKAKGSENQSLANLQTAKSLQNDKSKDTSQDFEESSLDTPYNNDDVNTSIQLHELTKFMETHHKDFFSKQFKKIPAPKDISTDIAQSEENRNKNRYKNICPYDHSRVHLKINTGKKEGDYINASYIRGFTDEATFIAAQGPNNFVINDFIRMLWEQKIKKVVMLTNLIEEGKVKCEKYWPDKDRVTYGEIEVKLAQTQTFTDYCLRIIELSKQSEITQVVTQYHFTSWPDQSIPYAPWAIIDFSEKVFSTISSDLIVVHCSAGVGRTGTFIALYNVLRQAEETGHIDFFKTLSKLREDRTLMIQTADQYEFLHIAAQAALACKGTSVTASNIRERRRHLEQREVSGLTKMKKEFQAIDKLCKDIRKAHCEDKENGDICNSTYQNTADLKINEKNRFPSIVPRNADRPYLNCDSSETGDYINAVFIPSLKKRDQLILTQLPMPTTVVDFWRLVEQYKVRLAVAFEKDKLATDKTIAIHIPTTKNMILQSMPFEIKCDNFKEDELWEEHTLTLYHEKSKSDSHELMHLQCKCSDLDARKLLTFVKKIRSYNLHADGKILFMCRNGATYSGLCCAVSLLLDRMDSDSCASVPLVVSIMKTVRPEIIPSVEQYKLLYDALERYTDVSSPYSNVDENFFPRGLKQTKVNKPTTDQTAADDESIYNNV